MNRFLPVAIALFLLAAAFAISAPIDSIGRIRALSPEEAAGRLPVAIEAIVTFRDPVQAALIAYDGKEGIYVELPRGFPPDGVTTGTRVRIEGETRAGGFLPIIAGQRVERLGVEPLPEPRRIFPAELFSASLDCQWVEVPAIISGVEEDRGVVLVAEVSGWMVKLLLPAQPDAQQRIAELMQRPVLVRGVVGTVFNAQRQMTGRHFFVPSFDQIIPFESAATDGVPRLRAIDELLRSDATALTRVLVRGVVTHAARDGVYLRGQGGSIFARAASTAGLRPGLPVEAEGFATVAPFRPILRATRLTPLERESAPQPQPQPLNLSGRVIVGEQHAELVTVDADLLARRDGPDGALVFQCRAGKWFFEASLPASTADLSRLGEGDQLRLTGICELTTTQALAFATSANGFRLLLRSPEDIVVLHHAPWWTLPRLLWALGALGALALAAFAWIALLRRRVTEQTRVIGVQIERSAVKDERQRIARELHDTIEQELAGLSAQLRNARRRLLQTPEQAATAIELAERMLRHCRDEARTSIRDLRSVALEQRGLRGALEEMLAPIATEAGVDFALEVRGAQRSLPGPIELHLLRIAQQAVANAIQHARPRRIQTHLEYQASSVTLEVCDDGCGFDSKVDAPRGHFGLAGIRERTDKMHATLMIDSAPGSGTTIRVLVPTASTYANGDSTL